jgi:predicted MFS family arabinose efflux permease
MGMIRSLASAYRASFAGLPREVWLLSGALLVNRAGTMVLPFLSLYLTQDLGLSAIKTGQIIGCFGVGSMVGSYLGGWLSDRMSPLRVQQLSLFASGAGFLLFSRLQTFTSLAIGIFVVAAVSDALRPALMVSVAHYSPPLGSKRSFALIRLAANLGMGIGPALAGLLAHYGYFWLFVGDAITCWMAGLMLVVVFGAGVRPAEEDTDASEPVGRSPWRDGPFLLFLLLIVILAMTFFQVWTTMPLFLRSFYNISERAIGLLLSINALLIALTEMLVIRAVERLDALRTVGVGALLVCAGLALLPFGPPYSFAVAAMVILTIGEMLAMPISNTVVAERAGRGQTGRYMGIYTLAFSTAFVIGPVAGTAVYERLGPDALWFGIGAIGIFLCLAFSVLSQPLRRRV